MSLSKLFEEKHSTALLLCLHSAQCDASSVPSELIIPNKHWLTLLRP